MSVFVRIEGLDPEDLTDAQAHDLADRLFADIHEDYPALYEDLTGVIPVLADDEHARLVEVSNIERPTAADEATDATGVSFGPLDRDDMEHVGDANDLDSTEYDWVDACGHAYVRIDEDDEQEVATDGGTDLATHQFRVQDDGKSIVYGPWDEDASEWMLGLSTESGERVRLLLGETAMYELWTEVQHVPWPREPEPRGTLSREIVEKVNGMDEDQLCEVLDAVDAVVGNRSDSYEN